MFYPIKLDKTRNFRYGMKAISLLEKQMKTPVSKIRFDEMTMEDIAAFVWAGLAHEDKELMPDKVMDLIDNYSNVAAVMEAAGEALNKAFGGENEDKSKEKNG